MTYSEAIKKGFLLVEHRFDLSSIYPGCFGTADAVVWNPNTRLLTVTDLKYGAGIPVEVENNVQLLYYALGALVSLKFPAKEVEIVVVQPRCPHSAGPVRRWRISAVDLLEFEANLVGYAKATEAPDAPLVPGDHCQFCRAEATCPALKEVATALAVRDFSPAKAYDPQDLGEVLAKADIIANWVSAVRAFAYAEAQRGREIPGWKLVAKRPTRKWKEDLNAFQLHRLFGKPEKDFLCEPDLKSPTQVEKLLKKDEKEKLKHCIVSESSGTKLVRTSESGEAVQAGPSVEFEVFVDPLS